VPAVIRLWGYPSPIPGLRNGPAQASAAHDDNIATTLVTYSSLLPITAYLDLNRHRSLTFIILHLFYRYRGFYQETVVLPISTSKLLQADFSTCTAKTAIRYQDGVDM
jgi:hypothetical protein